MKIKTTPVNFILFKHNIKNLIYDGKKSVKFVSDFRNYEAGCEGISAQVGKERRGLISVGQNVYCKSAYQ